MGNHRSVSAAARELDALERFGQSPNLVQFYKNGIGDAFLNSFLEDFRIRHKDVITNELNATAQPFCRLAPAVPVVFGQAIFQRVDGGVPIEPVFPNRDQSLRGVLRAIRLSKNVRPLLVELARGGIEVDGDIRAGLVASLLNRGKEEFYRFFV